MTEKFFYRENHTHREKLFEEKIILTMKNFTDHEKVCVAEVYFLNCLLAIFLLREGEISHCKVKQMRLNAKTKKLCTQKLSRLGPS